MDWAELEINLILADYFSMLNKELAGQSYNKTQHRQALLPLLNNRSNGSIEFKHANISAVLIKLGLPFIKGYQPRWNYQTILEDWVIQYVANHRPELEPQFDHFAKAVISEDLTGNNFAKILESAPERNKRNDRAEDEPISYRRRPIKINYLEREQQNATLGRLGEEFVMAYEKWRLIQAGKDAWADKVEWIADDNDAAGFDILSKNDNGTDRYIEVKTTKLSKETPLFFSQNEYLFSKENSSQYHLYRVFNFAQSPKLFIANGSFDDFCLKEPITYCGNF